MSDRSYVSESSKPDLIEGAKECARYFRRALAMPISFIALRTRKSAPELCKLVAPWHLHSSFAQNGTGVGGGHERDSLYSPENGVMPPHRAMGPADGEVAVVVQ